MSSYPGKLITFTPSGLAHFSQPDLAVSASQALLLLCILLCTFGGASQGRNDHGVGSYVVHTDSTNNAFSGQLIFSKELAGGVPTSFLHPLLSIRFIFASQASPWRSVVASLRSARVRDKKVQQVIPVDSLHFILKITPL